MADQSEAKYYGMTVKQMVLIGVLLVIFVGVILFGQGSGEAAGEVGAGTTAAVEQPAPRPSAKPAPAVQPIQWPKISLQDMLGHNPFHQPADLREPTPEEVAPPVEETTTAPVEENDTEAAKLEQERNEKMNAVLADLQANKVQLILRSGKKAAAKIGDRLVHEGDVIDGIRIVSILPDAVIVEATPAE